jgi:uncharacterized protein
MSTNLLQASSKRIESIDILRGFALLGIILVHMVEQYYAGPMPQEFASLSTQSIADNIASGFVGIFIIGKFYMIFSFLFGVSFYIQFSKSDSDKSFLVRFVWRLALLFAIGFIHHLHYRGDILTIYAMIGVGLLLFYRLPDKYLLWLAVLLVLNIPTVVTRGVQLFLPEGGNNPFGEPDQAAWLTYYNTVKSGAYADILKANYYEFWTKMNFQVISGRLYITFGLFLLGIYAGRKNFFQLANEKISMLKDFRFYAWMGIVFAVVTALLFFGGVHLFEIKIPEAANFLIGGFLYDLMNACLATIYVMWILLWLQKEKWQRRLAVFYPVGRMGLTTYLMQAVFGTLIYFSFGLSMLNEFGSLVAFCLALVLFVIQIVFARYWFRYFSYGPVEWVWRNLTYLKIHPITAQKAMPESV